MGIPIPLIILVYPQILFRMIDTRCVSYGGTFLWSMLISRAEMFVCVCVFLLSFSPLTESWVLAPGLIKSGDLVSDNDVTRYN